jgi:hypothetical protein
MIESIMNPKTESRVVLDEPRISASSAAARIGMSARRLVELAEQGRVTGAAQMAGPRGRWSFSLAKLQCWIAEQETAAACKRNERIETSTVEVKSGGAGSRSKVTSTEEAFARLFGRRQKGNLQRGVRR